MVGCIEINIEIYVIFKVQNSKDAFQLFKDFFTNPDEAMSDDVMFFVIFYSIKKQCLFTHLIRTNARPRSQAPYRNNTDSFTKTWTEYMYSIALMRHTISQRSQ